MAATTVPHLDVFVQEFLANGCHYADFQLAQRAELAGLGVVGTLDMRAVLTDLIEQGIVFTDVRGDYGLRAR